jgi:hypothetical protein
LDCLYAFDVAPGDEWLNRACHATAARAAALPLLQRAQLPVSLAALRYRPPPYWLRVWYTACGAEELASLPRVHLVAVVAALAWLAPPPPEPTWIEALKRSCSASIESDAPSCRPGSSQATSSAHTNRAGASCDTAGGGAGVMQEQLLARSLAHLGHIAASHPPADGHRRRMPTAQGRSLRPALRAGTPGSGAGGRPGSEGGAAASGADGAAGSQEGIGSSNSGGCSGNGGRSRRNSSGSASCSGSSSGASSSSSSSRRLGSIEAAAAQQQQVHAPGWAPGLPHWPSHATSMQRSCWTASQWAPPRPNRKSEGVCSSRYMRPDRTRVLCCN